MPAAVALFCPAREAAGVASAAEPLRRSPLPPAGRPQSPSAPRHWAAIRAAGHSAGQTGRARRRQDTPAHRGAPVHSAGSPPANAPHLATSHSIVPRWRQFTPFPRVDGAGAPRCRRPRRRRTAGGLRRRFRTRRRLRPAPRGATYAAADLAGAGIPPAGLRGRPRPATYAGETHAKRDLAPEPPDTTLCPKPELGGKMLGTYTS